MKKYKYYVALIIGIIFSFFYTKQKNISKEWIGIVLVILAIIIMFEFIDNSRLKRTKKWLVHQPSKLSYIAKFSFLIGLPISLLLSLIISSKAEAIYSVIFIIIPLTVIFGWIGHQEWVRCNKKFLEDKYVKHL